MLSINDLAVYNAFQPIENFGVPEPDRPVMGIKRQVILACAGLQLTLEQSALERQAFACQSNLEGAERDLSSFFTDKEKTLLKAIADFIGS